MKLFLMEMTLKLLNKIMQISLLLGTVQFFDCKQYVFYKFYQLVIYNRRENWSNNQLFYLLSILYKAFNFY